MCPLLTLYYHAHTHAHHIFAQLMQTHTHPHTHPHTHTHARTHTKEFRPHNNNPLKTLKVSDKSKLDPKPSKKVTNVN